MKSGDRVNHPKLGNGIILELCKYGGALVNFSDSSGVLVRVVHITSLEAIREA